MLNFCQECHNNSLCETENMRTRSSKTSDLKNTSTKNNRNVQSSTPRNQKRIGSASTTPPAVQNDPGVRNGKLLSPRRRAIVQTPGRDDVICSQHFDSQMVVGWDCNSPDTLRGIKRISGPDHDDVSDLVMRLIGQETDDEVFTKRNTPPLLGLWKEECEDQLLDNNNVVAHRQRRNRGRQRRKSGKESAVSKDLLSKLALALDKCSEVDEKEEHQGEGAGELFPLVEEATSKRLDCSDDLFNSESNDDDVKINSKSSNNTDKKRNILDSKSKNKVIAESCAKKRNEGNFSLTTNQNSEFCDRIGDRVETEIDDENWSDDELFEEDSFIVKATQVSTDVKKFVSPVFGMKRKNSSENVLPKSKCSRFSFQLGDSDNKNELTYTTSTTPENFTNLQSKSKGNTRPSYNKETRMTVSKPPLPNSTVSRCDNKKPPLPSGRTSASKQYTGTQVFGSYANPLQGNSCANYNRNTPLTRQRTSTSSSYTFTNSYSNSSTVSKSSDLQKQGSFTNLSFKKHNSFSGTGSQNLVSSRRRSVSGDKPCDSITSVENFYGSYNSNPVKNSIARTYPVVCSISTAGNSAKYNTGSLSTVSSTDKSNIVKMCSNVNNGVKRSIAGTSSSVIYKGVTNNSVKSSVTGTNTSVSKNSAFSHQMNNTRGTIHPTVCTTRVSSSKSAASSNKDMPKMEQKRSSFGSFDTSISDDLLCQLAEPDELLDSQLDINPTSVSKTSTCVSNFKNSHNFKSSDSSVKQYKFKQSQKKSPSPSGNNKLTTSSTLSAAAVSKREPVPALEQCSEDLFEDDDDMLLADDDGLTEPQILAMLDEVEMLATQQHNIQRNNSDLVQVSTGVKPNIINTALENNGRDSKQQSVGKYSTSDYGSDLDGSQGHQAGSQGHLTGSQGHLGGSPGQQSGSQGQSSSQSKYSPAEIERKKKEAIERRKLKLRKTKPS